MREIIRRTQIIIFREEMTKNGRFIIHRYVQDETEASQTHIYSTHAYSSTLAASIPRWPRMRVAGNPLPNFRFAPSA